ncbi:MAG: hypothetical protein ACYTGG_01835 [Planctomycetota bacterium]
MTSTVLNQDFAGFGDSPYVNGVFTLTGQMTFGNSFSVKASDNSYYVNVSNMRNQGQGVQFVPPQYGEVNRISYLSTGQYNDVLVAARNPFQANNQIDITVEASVVGQDGLLFVEAYNYNTRSWDFVTLGFLTSSEASGADFLLTGTLFGAQDYTSPDSSRDVLVRVYALGFGGGDVLDGPGTPSSSDFVLRIDLVDIDLNAPFGTNPGGIF